MTIDIQIDTTRCIGCGLCAAAVPTVFRVVGAFSTVHTAAQKAVRWKVCDAANACPTNAIAVTVT